MPSSHCSLLYHIVFATSGREPWLHADVRARLHPYLGGAIRDEGEFVLLLAKHGVEYDEGYLWQDG